MTTREPPRKPEYNVAVMNSAIRASKVGGAWKNNDGSITIKLNPFIHLNNDAGDLQIRLFPTTRDGEAVRPAPVSDLDFPDDDIPF